jgi:hypothetical protein
MAGRSAGRLPLPSLQTLARRAQRTSSHCYNPTEVTSKNPNQARTERTLLRAAKDFCAADLNVQLGRNQMRELRRLHSYDSPCCLPVLGEFVGDPLVREALPKSKWCSHCDRIAAEAVNYPYALFARRSAKVRMKRAFKKLSSTS